MKCPNCQVDLAMTHRENVEIDYCPKCRGVWLDRGELDKIIDRVSGPTEDFGDDRKHEYKQQPFEDYDRRRYRKKRSFLGDFFDFD